MNKKNIIILIVIVIIISGLFFFLTRKKPEIQPPSLTYNIIEQSTSTLFQLSGEGTRIRAINNALKNSQVRDKFNNPLLVESVYVQQYQLIENDEFEIVYQAKSDRFLITILQKPFPDIRQKAEEAFINLVGIKKEYLCSLNLDVDIMTPYWIDKNYAYQEYKLSFCE